MVRNSTVAVGENAAVVQGGVKFVQREHSHAQWFDKMGTTTTSRIALLDVIVQMLKQRQLICTRAGGAAFDHFAQELCCCTNCVLTFQLSVDMSRTWLAQLLSRVQS